MFFITPILNIIYIIYNFFSHFQEVGTDLSGRAVRIEIHNNVKFQVQANLAKAHWSVEASVIYVQFIGFSELIMLASFSILQEESIGATNNSKIEKKQRRALGDISLNSAIINTPMPLKSLQGSKSVTVMKAPTAVKFKIEEEILDPRDMICFASNIHEDPYDVAVMQKNSFRTGIIALLQFLSLTIKYSTDVLQYQDSNKENSKNQQDVINSNEVAMKLLSELNDAAEKLFSSL